MSKKTSLFFGILIIMILIIPSSNTYSSDLSYPADSTGLIWYESEEPILTINHISASSVNVSTRDDYDSYYYSRNINVKTYSNGQEILLFRHSMECTFYYYPSTGNVNLASLSRSISNINVNCSVMPMNPQITNTDGSFSVGKSVINLSSSLYSVPDSIIITYELYNGSTNVTVNVNEIWN